MKKIIWILTFTSFFITMFVSAKLNRIEDVPNPNTEKVFPSDISPEDMKTVELLEETNEIEKQTPKIDIIEEKTNLDIDTVKSKSILAIDKSIVKLNEFKDKIEKSPASIEMKMGVINVIDETISYLEELKKDIESAEDLDDIKEIWGEAKITFKDNKETIKLLIKEMKSKLTNLSVNQIEKAIDDIEKVLKLLKIICPSQKENIEILENNLDDIANLIISVNDYIASENYQAAKNTILEAQNMILETSIAAQEIYEGCGL